MLSLNDANELVDGREESDDSWDKDIARLLVSLCSFKISGLDIRTGFFDRASSRRRMTWAIRSSSAFIISGLENPSTGIFSPFWYLLSQRDTIAMIREELRSAWKASLNRVAINCQTWEMSRFPLRTNGLNFKTSLRMKTICSWWYLNFKRTGYHGFTWPERWWWAIETGKTIGWWVEETGVERFAIFKNVGSIIFV